MKTAACQTSLHLKQAEVKYGTQNWLRNSNECRNGAPDIKYIEMQATDVRAVQGKKRRHRPRKAFVGHIRDKNGSQWQVSRYPSSRGSKTPYKSLKSLTSETKHTLPFLSSTKPHCMGGHLAIGKNCSISRTRVVFLGIRRM